MKDVIDNLLRKKRVSEEGLRAIEEGVSKELVKVLEEFISERSLQGLVRSIEIDFQEGWVVGELDSEYHLTHCNLKLKR